MKQLTYKQIANIAKDAIRSQDWTEETVKDHMNTTLETVQHDIILEALGVDKTWSNWRIRLDGSFAKVVSKSKLQEVAQRVWDDTLSDEASFQLTLKEITALKKALRETYVEVLEENIRKLAIENADLDARGVFNDFMNRPDPTEIQE